MKVLLFGDSITAYLPKDVLHVDWFYNLNKNIEQGKDNYTFYKCGTENYPTEWLRDYVFPNLDKSIYDAIVLQCGINDFFMPYQVDDYPAKTPEETYKSIIDFARMIKDVTGVKVALQSLYPAERGLVAVEDLKYINNELAKACKVSDIEFLDMYDLLASKSGGYKKGLSDDGLHPSREGYKLVASKLSQIFAEEKPKEPNFN